VIFKVKIEIKDSVWSVYQKSWALDGVTEHDEVVRMLEVEMSGIANEIFKHAEMKPEDFGLQKISLKDDGQEKKENRT
jgi:hypothetical protein